MVSPTTLRAGPVAARPYKAILLDFTGCAACTALALGWVFVSVRRVTDNYLGASIIFAPSLVGLGAGAFFLWRALNGLKRRFFSSMGWDQYL